MIKEEFKPKEVITLHIERKWKYRNPESIVKQVYEFPVLVIRNTGKAILVTNKDGTSYANSKNGDALWIPSYALNLSGNDKYTLKNGVLDVADLNKFIKKNGYKPKSETPIKEGLCSFREFLEEKEKSETIN